MRVKSFLLLGFLAVLMTSCSDSADRSAGAGGVGDTLTVLTYNLWHGLNPKGTLRFQEYETAGEREERWQCFFHYARQLNPDILFLEEVNPAPGLSRRIARELGCDYTYDIDNAGMKIGALGLPVNLRSGMAILAKKELHLKALGERKVSGPFGWTGRWTSFQLKEFRDAVAAEVTVHGRKILLLCVHLHHGPEADADIRGAVERMVEQKAITRQRGTEILDTFQLSSARRRMELERAMAWARTMGGENTAVLFAGDFNASPDAPELAWLKKDLGFRSVTGDEDPAQWLMTWDYGRNPNTHFFADFVPVHEFEPEVMGVLNPIVVQQTKRLDYIFYRRMEGWLRVREAGLFADQAYQGRFCSDHFGLYAVLETAK